MSSQNSTSEAIVNQTGKEKLLYYVIDFMTPYYLAHRKLFAVTIPATLFATAAILFLYLTLGSLNIGKPQIAAAAATPNSVNGTVYLSTEATDTPATATASTQQELHIANDGLTLVRGAQLVNMNGSTMQVALSWGGIDMQWNVVLQYNTEYMNNNGTKIDKSAIHEGDIITVTGTLQNGGSETSLNAQYVRDQSI